MKTVKKISAVVIALVLALSMSLVAFAANDGKITVENAVNGQSYSIYKIFNLESFDEEGHYLYTVEDEWLSFVKTQDYFVGIDTDGYVAVSESTSTADNAAKFAAAAKQYAKYNNIAPLETKTADSGTVVFENLELGYYLLDSTLGTICSLDTTDKEIIVREKNDVPELDKEVKEDSTGVWGKENTAELGETVEFKITVTAQPGAENYIVRDKLSEGLTLNPDSIEVEGLTKDTEYIVLTSGLTNADDTFEVRFTQSYLDTITDKTNIVITYTAVVNENAVIYDESNPNDASLIYGDEASPSETPDSKTDTYVFEFDVVKTDAGDKVLQGAIFEMYTDAEGGTALKLVKDGTENGVDVYHVATAADFADTSVTKVEKFTAGRVTITGLDAGTYYLKETQAPNGYNALQDRIAVKVEKDTAASLKANVEKYGTKDGEDYYIYKDGGVQVINNTGAELPSTGGIGTTIFYVIGAFLVAGAVIILVSRRRMSCEA